MKRFSSPKAGSPSVDLRDLAECVEKFSGKTIVLLGDFVADEFRYGDISRVSREAPVLILKHRETQVVPGGGANAANNLVSLGAKVLPITVVGDDAAGEALFQYFRQKGVSTSGILRTKGRATPTKSRFLAGWAHTVAQQVLRFDYEPQAPLPDGVRRKIQQKLYASLRDADALAVSDYGFLSSMKLQALLVTRGRHGMALFEAGDRLTHIPVHGSDQAVDVTGAGDTVLAAYTLALACGASALDAAQIANIAGGLVVMRRGTATVSRQELLDAIRGEISGAAS